MNTPRPRGGLGDELANLGIALLISTAGFALLLRAALQTLPSRQRAAVVLRVTMGWSELETADALNCAPGTVGSLLHRGLAALRVQLTPDDGSRADDHSASLPQLREGQP